MSDGDGPQPRRRRRAVGPPGAAREPEPGLDLADDRPEEHDDTERLRRDVPPHHDQGV